MRRIILLMVTLLGLAGTAQADYFFDLKDFSGKLQKGRDALQLSGGGSWYKYTYTHDLILTPEAAAITSASLLLSHYGNSGNGELWLLYGENEERIGALSVSNASWNDQVFTIPAELYSGISGELWNLVLVLNESTPGTDNLWIDKSELYGTYSPVPVPAAGLLLGSGLIGGALLRKRKWGAGWTRR